jgi:peptide chain release factor 2
MEPILKRAEELTSQVEDACDKLKVDELSVELEDKHLASTHPGFWENSAKAQEVMKETAKLESRIGPWLELRKSAHDLKDLAKLGDSSLEADLTSQLDSAEKTFERLKKQLKFSGEFDDHDVILSIHAGAGGTDAQDWAQMLLRMYVRWSESHGYSAKTVDESAGEEAGIKSATLEISGEFVYGKLRGEHGVHRLVRLSPYNSDNLRQTSFAKVEILPKIDKPEDVEIDEKDLKVDVYRSGGHGGQSVNTTDSAVRVTHLPTNIVVAIQNERSQLQNKETAMTILRSKVLDGGLDPLIDAYLEFSLGD